MNTLTLKEAACEAKERPILFSASMVLAILQNKKTQTRRVLRPQPHIECGKIFCGAFHPEVTDRHGKCRPGKEIFGAYSECGEWGCKFPYGRPGDKLWVKETYWIDKEDGAVLYAANKDDFETVSFNKSESGLRAHNWKPGIFMPRLASRISLEITSVRVEALQDISEADAMAEGVEKATSGALSAFDAYKNLWGSIYGERAWEENPFVWVIDFKRLNLKIA